MVVRDWHHSITVFLSALSVWADRNPGCVSNRSYHLHVTFFGLLKNLPVIMIYHIVHFLCSTLSHLEKWILIQTSFCVYIFLRRTPASRFPRLNSKIMPVSRLSKINSLETIFRRKYLEQSQVRHLVWKSVD